MFLVVHTVFQCHVQPALAIMSAVDHSTFFHFVDWKSIERQASQERIELETKRNSVSKKIIIIFSIIFPK